jgi:uncharacterized NAD-dependent epimerase/dehydratase family protein
MNVVPTATILVRENFLGKHGKTAHGLIRYGQRYKILSVIDESCAGSDAGELLGLGKLEIPIISEVPEEGDAMVIGVAPSGGKLPQDWRRDIKTAIENGMDIVSGLHEFIGDDLEFARLAEEKNVAIWDVRRPPLELVIARGYRAKVPVVLSIGTDACVGKRTVALELVLAAKQKGYDPGFIATGQTGLMIGCDAGICVDSLPGDFISGTVEKLIQDVEAKGKDIIFIEGQGSISHHAYGAVAHGILYGSQPHGLVLVHSPSRKTRSSFPSIPMPSAGDELRIINAHFESPLLGIGLNCSENTPETDCSEYIAGHEKEFEVPVEDVLSTGADNPIDYIKSL